MPKFRLEVFPGDLKRGYWWAIITENDRVIHAGYCRFEKHAQYDGERAISLYQKEEVA